MRKLSIGGVGESDIEQYDSEGDVPTEIDSGYVRQENHPVRETREPETEGRSSKRSSYRMSRTDLRLVDSYLRRR